MKKLLVTGVGIETALYNDTPPVDVQAACFVCPAKKAGYICSPENIDRA